ncbi:MAG: DUF58 domain-containing protein [Acidimicrobiales bacterium]|jgi:uncharacterized protein (DUF58 family)
MVRPFGWVVIGAAFLSWLFGVWLGWLELMTIAGICGALVLICCVFLFGKQTLGIDLEIRPARVVVGERAAGQLTVTNGTANRLLPTKVELMVGSAVANFDIPSLGAGDSHEELFQISTERRGVIPVGPARLVRADPIGLFARVVKQSDPVSLYVHPVTVRVPGVGPGFLRDLEGAESVDLSPSDLAFHSLREYVPGDDRRHIHWKTSARSGRLMVQQFVDTRRSHVVVVLDHAASAFVDSDQFELAVSVAGSLGIRSIADDQIRTVIVGSRTLPTMTRSSLLDALAGVEAGGTEGALERSVALASRTTGNPSIVLIVTGAGTSDVDIRRMARRFSIDVRVVAIRVGTGELEVQKIRNVLLLDIERLDDLPRITNMAVSL